VLDAGLRQPDEGGDLPAAADDGVAEPPAQQALLRDRWFLLFWGGQSTSLVGTAITQFALPTLAVLVLHAGAAQVGILIALQRVPFPFLALPVGAHVDRIAKRPLMIASDAGRALLIASMPAAAVLGVLDLPLLFAVALVTGILSVFFDIAYLAYFPTLTGRERLLRANTLVEASDSVAGLVGPGLAGVLVQLIGAARTLSVDAATYVVSAVSLLLVRKPEPPAAPRSSAGTLAEIRDGLALVFRQPVLRSLVITVGMLVLAGHLVEPALLILAYRIAHLTPAALGVGFSVEGVGAVLGTALSGPIGRRFGNGPPIIATAIVDAFAFALFTVAPSFAPAAVFAVAFFVLGASGTVNNIYQLTVRQLLTPDSHRARMNSIFRTVYWGAWPLGNLIGGFAAAVIGPAQVIAVAAALVGLVGVAMAFTPVRKA
jgi:MFS family permease